MSIQQQPVRGEFKLNQLSRLGLRSWNDAATYEREADRRHGDSILDRLYDEASYVLVRNVGATAAEPYQPIEITDIAVKPNAGGLTWTMDRVILDAQVPSGGNPRHNFVLPLKRLLQDQVGQALIDGMVTAKVYFEDTALIPWCRRCDIEPGFTNMKAMPEGRGEIIWRDPTATIPGDVDCIVDLGPPDYVELPVKTTQDVAAGGVAPANTLDIYQDAVNTTYRLASPAKLDWMHDGLQISTDKECLVAWFPSEKLWRFVGAQCEDTEPPMTFRGDFDPANAPYAPGSVVNTQSFTMHAINNTSQDPTPFPNNNPSWSVGDSPSWTPNSDPGTIITGNEYTFDRTTVLEGWRVWIPTVSADHTYTVLVRDTTIPGKPRITSNQQLNPSATGWVAVAVPPVILYESEIIEILLVSENTAGSTDHLNAPWVYAGRSQNSEPFAGGFNNNNQSTILRIDLDDDNGTDRTTELAGIVPGDVIEIYDGVNRVDLSVVSNDGLGITAYSYAVAVINSVGSLSVGAPYTIQVQRSGSSTDYVSDLNWWQTNTPSWASQVRGIVQTGGTPSYNQHAYGADILEDGWNVPSDWEVVSISSREL